MEELAITQRKNNSSTQKEVNTHADILGKMDILEAVPSLVNSIFSEKEIMLLAEKGGYGILGIEVSGRLRKV